MNCKTKRDLCAKLKLSRPTVDRYLARPNAPAYVAGKGWPLEAVAEFVALTAKKESTSAAVSGDIAALRAREIALRCDRLAHRLAVERGEHLVAADVCAWLNSTLTGMRQVLHQKLCNELPSNVAGHDAPATRERCKAVFNATMRELRTLADGPPTKQKLEPK